MIAKDDVIFFTLRQKSIIPDTSASDFEEQLGHGLGKDANDTDIHDVAGNCEEDLMWYCAQKNLNWM